MQFEKKDNKPVQKFDDIELELQKYKQLYCDEKRNSEEQRMLADHCQREIARMKGSFSWKVTKPLRGLKILCGKLPFVGVISKMFSHAKRKGWKYTIRKIMGIFSARKMIEYNKSELAAQRKYIFGNHIKFSIIVPLYNTPKSYLKQMINSVFAQTYFNWELCLADGSDAEHYYVETYCKKLAEEDDRIKYKKLTKNLGISGNTNAALEMATGDYIALFDHDDKLHPSALFEMAHPIYGEGADFVYTDEAKFLKNEARDAYDFVFKPDFSPDMLRSCNYICHFSAFSRELYEQVGGFRDHYDGSQDYDMILRLTEKAKKIVHVPQTLYFWRCHAASVASNLAAKPYAIIAAREALASHLERVGLNGTVEDSTVLSTYRIKYELNGTPLVSVIIPNKDHVDDLRVCLDSIYGQSTYENFEVIVVENNSEEADTFNFYKEIEQKYHNLKVVRWADGFNYSKITNFGFEYASGEYVILLNNDIEIITPDWIEELLRYTQRDDVAATGMMLYYPDNTIQHAGVVLGIGGVASHVHKGFRRGDPGYFGRASFAQNYSIVTAAAMMVKSSVYKEVGGLDGTFAVAFNDVDFCMKIRRAGYNIVWTPYAEAYHYESKSRGYEDTEEKRRRFVNEVTTFQDRWKKEMWMGDPYYNVNLTLERTDFTPKDAMEMKRHIREKRKRDNEGHSV